jgi:putative peptidoglycan lipid II flippase
LSIGLGALINAAFLLAGLLKSGGYKPSPGWAAFIARVLLACSVLGGGLAWAARNIDWIGLQPHWAQRSGWMAAVLAGSVVAYFGVLWASGLNLRQFVRRG